MPSEIVIEVASGNAAEALHPTFPSAVIGIDVLHMKRRASYTDALGEVDRLMRDAAMLGIATIDRRAIGAQHGFAFQTVAAGSAPVKAAVSRCFCAELSVIGTHSS